MGGVGRWRGGQGRIGRALAAHDERLAHLEFAVEELERAVEDVGALVEGGDVEAYLAERGLHVDVERLGLVFTRSRRAHLESQDRVLLFGLVDLLVDPVGDRERVLDAVGTCGEKGGVDCLDQVSQRRAGLEAPGFGSVVVRGGDEREKVVHLEARQHAVAVAVEQLLWEVVGG